MSFWIYHPLISALVVALICCGTFYLFEQNRPIVSPFDKGREWGSRQNEGDSTVTNFGLFRLKKSMDPSQERNIKSWSIATISLYFGSVLIGFLFAYFATGSVAIAIPFASVCTGIPVLALESSKKKQLVNLQKLWPEILDHIISGLNSGLSLAETLMSLSMRGPNGARKIFESFTNDIKKGTSLSVSLRNLQRQFQDPTADQVCTVLVFASQSGSRDTAITLRVLSDYIRSDLAIRDEVSARHGWVRNSASIASIAPWALLLILASQPDAVNSYSTTSGALVLGIGAALTFIAYLWMRKVGSMEKAPRVFEI